MAERVPAAGGSGRTSLSGPRVPARSGHARSLVVLLHGYGASGDDLIEIGRALSPVLPDTAFVSPNAPERLPFAGAPGFQWFALSRLDPDELARGVRAAAPVLERFLADELSAAGLGPERLALVGFSQGTMMALHVGLRLSVAPAAIVGLSGVVAAPERLESEITSRPPVLLVHGAEDEVIPVAALALTREALAHAGVTVEWHIRPGLAHGIDEAGLSMAASFLAARLSGGARLAGSKGR